jgi:hypothetical protein
MYCGLPATASGASVAASAKETALLGPDIRCRLEPNSAATAHGSTAAAKPICGGSPASVAKAIACGSTSTAPSRPANRSARSVARSSSRTQGPNRRVAIRRGGKRSFKRIAV